MRNFIVEVAVLIAEVPEVLPDMPLRTVVVALHSLKGLAGTVGAEALADAAQGMERSLHVDHSPAMWAVGHAQLVATSEQAARHGKELAELLEVNSPPAVGRAVLELSRLPAALAKLRQLLETSSLDALPLFEELLRDYGERMRSEFSELNSAIEQFNFAVAAQQCDTMLNQLSTDLS